METRYDLSFMKEYAEIYELDNRWLANKFNCGIKIVDRILNGELKVKEGPLEEIMYEFGYRDYETFKTDIIKKTITRKKYNEEANAKKELIEEYVKQKEMDKQKKAIEQEMLKPQKIDFNDLNNKERIIISLLISKDYQHKDIVKFLRTNENYINLFDKNLNYPTDDSIPDKQIKLRDGVNSDTKTTEIFDYNNMNNKDRIVISLLCDENLIHSIKQIADFTGIDEEYIKEIYKIIISNIDYVSQLEKGFQKTKV